jgi:putative MATE family efflux protein
MKRRSAQTPKADKMLWSSLMIKQQLREAIRGSDVDYTRIPINRAIFLLAVPMILELVMESTFAVVDIYFVGKLGPSAVATVGFTETFLFLIYAIAIGLAMGVTAIIARRIGEHNLQAASRAALQSILLALLCSIPFAIIGIVFAQELLSLMGAEPQVLEQGYLYTQWMLGGNLVIMLLFTGNAVFRGAGDAAIAMRVLLIANGINIVLDPLLIFGLGPIPTLGIEGAAIASNIGRGVGVVFVLTELFGGGKHIRIRLAKCQIELKLMGHILWTSLGGIGQMFIAMTSWIFLMRILAGIGIEAVAGATITIRVMLFSLMPAWGLSNATATLVGQSLGAGSPKRAEAIVWRIGFYNMCFLLLVSFFYFCFSEAIIGIFTDDPTVIAVGAEWLRILAYGYFIYGWWMVSSQAFNGAGDTHTPTWINMIFFWTIQIPLSWYLSIPLGWQQSGVFWGVFFSETAAGLFTLWLFRQGNWKNYRV